jgi:large conductance mechanosensitive channel
MVKYLIKDKSRGVHMRVVGEFRDFLKEYKVVGLAVAFIMGVAATALVQSLVNNIIMPLITPFMPAGGWQTAVLAIGPIKLGWGAFLAAVINFVILAFCVFLIAKYVMKEEKVTKK